MERYPKISVIIPTHDRPDTVGAAVRSVLAQTWKDLELFVIDVGLKKRADTVLEEFTADPRFHHVKHPAELRGGAARNVGAQFAQGEWLAFLDDDDEWLPEKLEIQMKAILKASQEIGFCFSGVINDFGEKQEVTHVPLGEQDLSELSYARFKGFLTVTLMIRRDVYREVGGFDESLPSHQDPELILRIAQRWKGLGIDQPLVRVNMRPGRDHVGGDLGRRIEGRKMILQKHAAEYAMRPKVLARHWFQIGLWERERGNHKAAGVAMKNAFRIDPTARHLAHLLISMLNVLWRVQLIRLAFPVLVSVALISIAVSASDIEEIYAAMIEIDAVDIVALIFLVLGTHVLSALRWKCILVSAGYYPEMKKIFLSFFANVPATKILPAYTGDYLRVMYLRGDVPTAKHAGLITTEALLDIAIIGVAAALGGLISGKYPMVFLGVASIAVALTPILIIRWRYVPNERHSSFLQNFFLAFINIRIMSRAFAAAVVLTAASWGLLLLVVYGIFLMLGAPVSFFDILAVHPAILLFAILPISFGGIGVREYSMSVLYGGIVSSSVALTAGIVQTAVSIFFVPMLLLPLFIYASKRL